MSYAYMSLRAFGAVGDLGLCMFWSLGQTGLRTVGTNGPFEALGRMIWTIWDSAHLENYAHLLFHRDTCLCVCALLLLNCAVMGPCKWLPLTPLLCLPPFPVIRCSLVHTSPEYSVSQCQHAYRPSPVTFCINC